MYIQVNWGCVTLKSICKAFLFAVLSNKVVAGILTWDIILLFALSAAPSKLISISSWVWASILGSFTSSASLFDIVVNFLPPEL